MDLRSYVVTTLFGVVLVSSNHGRCAGHANLDAAFLASFGQRAPLVRTAQPSIYDDTSTPPKLIKLESVAFDVRPERLVPLGGRKYALISYEIDPGAGLSRGGEIAVSYLDKTANLWTLEHLWPEFLYSGVGGHPADAGAEIHQFSGDPLFMARTQWCGTGECSESIGVIRFSRSGPVAYADIPADATSPTQGSPVHNFQGNTCENYDVRTRIKPPRWSGSLFSIQYDGWTARPGTLSPKTPLHLFTSYVPEGAQLLMQPVVPVPTCGR